jgi:high-affinity Fe2+/Pb2+ permease
MLATSVNMYLIYSSTISVAFISSIQPIKYPYLVNLFTIIRIILYSVRKTGSGVGNLVLLKVFLGPGASFLPY